MSKFIMCRPQAGAPGAMSATGTDPLWPMGGIARASDNATGASSLNCGAAEFIYCCGSDIASIGQFVQIAQGAGSCKALILDSANSASKFPVGVAAGKLSATSVYGWVQIQGLCDYARGTNSSIAAGAPLYFCVTAGLLDSVVDTGSQIANVVCPVSYTSSQSASMTVQLNRPFNPGLTASF